MKRVLTIGLALATAVALMAQGADDEKEFEPGTSKRLRWYEWEKAIKRARGYYKPVLLYLYGSENLDFCKAFETEALEESSVRSAAGKFVCVKFPASDKENREVRKFLKIEDGAVGVYLLDCTLKILARVDDAEDLEKKAFTKRLKEFGKEHKKFARYLKALDKLWKEAERAQRRKRIRDYYGLLQKVVEFGKYIEDERVDEANKTIKEAEQAGAKLLDEAEKLVEQAEQQFRFQGTRGFRQDLVNRAQQLIMEVSSKYPVGANNARGARVAARLSQLCQAYKQAVEEEQNKNKK